VCFWQVAYYRIINSIGKMKLTGISIGYENNLIYKCNNTDDLNNFKSYLDSSELKRINLIHIWYELENNKKLFLTVLPGDSDNIWKVDIKESQSFSLEHSDDHNLLDEIEEYLKNTGLS
jgi:hypothetical protein